MPSKGAVDMHACDMHAWTSLVTSRLSGSIDRSRSLHVLLALAVAGLIATSAAAQDYPDRPIRMVVPTTGGSPTDVMARLAAQSLSTTIGQPVVVENRPGGGGIIGTRAVVSADPDGYTLLFTEGAKHLMTPALYDNVGFDPVKDLTPVATAGGGAFVLVVAPSVPAKSVQELVAYARSHPGKINYGFGQGTLPHILGASLKVMSGVDISSIPYKGGSQAVADMLGGRIQMNFGTTATLLQLIRQGKLRAGRHRRDARPGLAGCADDGRKGRPGAYAALLDGGLGAAASSAADRREAQRRCRRRVEIAEACRRHGAGRIRYDADRGRQDAGFRRSRITEMARRRQKLRREGQLEPVPQFHRHHRGVLGVAQRQRRLDVAHMRRAGQLANEILKGLQIRRHAFEHEVDLAGQHPAFAHQRLTADEILEGL
jgi:tripartite-type tricarboxylate transporter receptor subunit TctC